MQIKDLTIDELKAVIRETVMDALEDLLPDPDKGRTVRESFQQEILEIWNDRLGQKQDATTTLRD